MDMLTVIRHPPVSHFPGKPAVESTLIVDCGTGWSCESTEIFVEATGSWLEGVVPLVTCGLMDRVEMTGSRMASVNTAPIAGPGVPLVSVACSQMMWSPNT